MSGHLWTPGAAGPLDEFVARVTGMVSTFAAEQGLDQAEVRLELGDGSRLSVQTMTPEPGFGFLAVTPHGDDEPRLMVVPIGFIRSIEISAPDPERPIGFVVSE